MFARTAKEQAVATAISTIAAYFNKSVIDPTISIEDNMKMLQWVYKKIPEINRLLIAINTERISLK